MPLKNSHKIIGSVILFTLLIVMVVIYWTGSFRTEEDLYSVGIKHEPELETGARLFDWDGDGQEESFWLDGNIMTVARGSDVIWRSPPEWQVTFFVLADSMHDGQTKLNLSVWKPGSYGPSKPFWLEEEDESVKNHLFIMRLVEGQVKPAWQSSNLPKPICSFTFNDIDLDGRLELIVQEGDYEDGFKCQPKRVKYMQWKMWNFFEL